MTVADERQKALYEETIHNLPANPKAINLELTNICNLKCEFCLNPMHDFRKKGMMKDEILYKLVDETTEDTLIILCGVGEPTLHNKFLEYIKVLSNKFRNIYLVTNGQFEEHIISTILDSNISKITFSLDYFDNNDYFVNKGGNVNTIKNNINTLINLRGSKPEPVIQINMLAEKGKEKQIKQALSYFNDVLGGKDFVYSRYIKSLASQVKINAIDDDEDWFGLERLKEEISKDVNTDKFFVENWCKFLNLEKPFLSRQICRHPFIYTMALYDGRLVFCCIDFNAKMVAGDLHGETLQEIWNGDNYRKFRQNMIDFEFEDYPLCVNCGEWYRQK